MSWQLKWMAYWPNNTEGSALHFLISAESYCFVGKTGDLEEMICFVHRDMI